MSPHVADVCRRLVLLALLVVSMVGCNPLSSGGGHAAPPPPPEQAAHRRFVDGAKTISGNGRGWNRAFRTLEEGLAACAADATITELWLAAGTYRPADTAGIDSHFHLLPGVSLYGSFTPGQSDPAARDFTANQTILDGAIGGGTPAEQVRHVVVGAEGAVLDGFVISKGWARGATSSDQNGGGLMVSGCAMTLRWCRFDGNRAEADGGGLLVTDGAATLEDCLFTGNLGGHGGGVQATRSDLRLLRCHFIGNEGVDALSLGGGVATYFANVWVERCHFADNRTGEHGGGLWVDNGEAFVVASVFRGNAARWGGGTSIYQATADIANCAFVANRAAHFVASADYNGAGAINSNTNDVLRVANCTLVGNTSLEVTPGIGGALITANGDDVFDNCIFWGNRVTSPSGLGHAIRYYNGTVTLSYSWFEGVIAAPWVYGFLPDTIIAAVGNIFSVAAPGFADEADGDGLDDQWGTDDDGLHLLSTSDAAGSGSTSALEAMATTPERAAALATDLAGEPRTSGGTISMGAYEGVIPVGSG